ncbi:FlaD/FlaE family flagellar protein [Methanomethylovorans sp.]|uniref:FlaD/FlaE family flagellar protein n=1 Tax=Methanomethylovorans sp. TaxID=2758717 RepID=UPI00345EDF76
MSKFPWETADQKKEEEQDTDADTVSGPPPFAPGAQVPDLFQKAFSDSAIQEEDIDVSEKSSSSSLSEPSAPLFSMELPDISSLQPDQELASVSTTPFTKDMGQGPLTPLLSQDPSMGSTAAPARGAQELSKAQVTRNKKPPLFELALHDDVPNGSSSVQSHEKQGISSPDPSKLFAQGPNINGPSSFNSPVFPAPDGNISSFPQQLPAFDAMVPPLQTSRSSDHPFPGTSSAFVPPVAEPSLSQSSSAVSRDPFAQGASSPASDPFAGQTVPSGSPPFPFFGQNPPFPDGFTPGHVPTASEKKTGIGERVTGVSGNLATSISELANSIFANVRSLTKGKSLLEKMEKIKEGNVREEDDPFQLPDDPVYGSRVQARDNTSSIASAPSPFDKVPSDTSPFSPSEDAAGLSVPSPRSEQVGLSDVHDSSISAGDFVKVTPVENPLFDFPQELKIDNEPGAHFPFHSDLSGAGAGPKQSSSDTLSRHGKTDEGVSSPASTRDSQGYAPVVSGELDDLREKLELSAGNISQIYGMYEELSGNVTVLGDSVKFLQSSSDDVMKATGMKFDDLDERMVRLESHLSGMEQQVAHVLSENKDILSSLSSIEKHISELVGSYTALVSKMQENAQENDDRFSVLSAKADAMEELVPRLMGIERSGAEMSAAMQDMKGKVLKLGTEVSSVSAAQQGIRDEMTELSGYVEGELKRIGARGRPGQSIQLAHIMKNSSSVKLCMEWLEFLMELVGRNNLPDILSYYEELGWITEEVRMELMRYAEGIDFYMEKPDWKLTPDDHVKSIWFIENLAGIKVDKNKLSVIDRDIEKVRKSSEIYNI